MKNLKAIFSVSLGTFLAIGMLVAPFTFAEESNDKTQSVQKQKIEELSEEEWLKKGNALRDAQHKAVERVEKLKAENAPQEKIDKAEEHAQKALEEFRDFKEKSGLGRGAM